jgi:dephospho-CoA kinase
VHQTGPENPFMTVALTGNVASGKSTVAGLWRQAGVAVVRADDLAREVVAPGSEGLQAVVAVFGSDVLRGDGSLDRDALRDRVFKDEGERRVLEEILHPRIRAFRNRWLAQRHAEGVSLAVAEIPLLFEAGLEGDFDAVVLVDAPEEERLRRLVEDRGISEEEALRMMAAQIPATEKRARADFVLDNDGTPEELRERSLALLDLFRSRVRAGGAARA